MKRRANWSEEEDKVLYEMYGKQTYATMLESLPTRTKSAIAGRATKLGLKGNNSIVGSLAHKIYDINYNYFDEINIENCAFAGLIASDGCIIEPKRAVYINLKIEDGDYLREWAKKINYSGPVNNYINIKSEYSPNSWSTRLYVNGVPTWLSNLKKYFNITPRKSLTLLPPNLIEKDHIIAYMSGYIDGDGSIMYRQLKKFDPKMNKTYESALWTIVFCGGLPMCVWFKAQCDHFYPPKTICNGIEKKQNQEVYQYRITGNRALMLAKDLLSLNIPRIERKWERIRSYLDLL